MALSNYKIWYDEAMCASNEAGFAGVSAAQTIRDLDSDNARLTRERDQALADRDLAIELLAKYRQHVESCGSIDFLDQIGDCCSDVTFTPAEVAALLALREDNRPTLSPSEHTALFTRAGQVKESRND